MIHQRPQNDFTAPGTLRELCLTLSGKSIWFCLYCNLSVFLKWIRRARNYTLHFQSALWVSALLKANRVHILKWLRCFWKSSSVNTLTFFLMKLHLTYPHKYLQNHLILFSWLSVKLPLDVIPTEELQFAFCDHSLFYWPWLSCYYLHAPSICYLFSLGSYLDWQCSRTGLLFPFCAYTACTGAWLASQWTFPAMTK